MSAVTGLLGIGGGAGETGFDAPKAANLQQGVNTDQTGQAYNQNQAALQQQQNLLAALQGQNGLQNQSQVYGQLQGIASGAVNPAQAQFAQNTAQNVANQAALQAGQRGASQNVGLIARQAGQQGAQIQQQAAGQAATQQALNQINAIGAAGQMANTQAGQQIQQTNTNTAAQQAEQGNLLNALGQYNQAQVGSTSSMNAANAAMAGTRMQGQQSLIGGIMNTVGAGAKMLGGAAQGGMISGYAGGGPVSGPQSSFGQFLAGVSAPQASAPELTPYPTSNQGSDDLSKGVQSALTGLSKAGNTTSAAAPESKGGMVDVVLSPGEKVVPPSEVKKAAQGKAKGKTVPGKAEVEGDSYENDKVPAKLKAGSIVVPRSRVKNNPAGFVQDTLAKRGRK